MSTVFLILLAVGVIYAIISSFNIFDFDIDFDGGFPILSPIVIASFLTTFGGIGLYLSYQSSFSIASILGISIGISVVTSLLIFLLVVIPMTKADRSTAKTSREMIGETAEVITSMSKHNHGEIIYTQGMSRISAPALSLRDEKIEMGSHVEIVDVIGGTFIVKKITKK